jgi:hypothetical protein
MGEADGEWARAHKLRRIPGSHCKRGTQGTEVRGYTDEDEERDDGRRYEEKQNRHGRLVDNLGNPREHDPKKSLGHVERIRHGLERCALGGGLIGSEVE